MARRVKRVIPDPEKLRLCKGCPVRFMPVHDRQLYHTPICKARAAGRRPVKTAAVPRSERVYRVQPVTSAFWYEVLDVIHFYRLALPPLVAGCATIHRKDWIRLFYRSVRARKGVLEVSGGEETASACRAWERFKQKARGAALLQSASPQHSSQDGENTYLLADAASGFIHIDIRKAYDDAFTWLGPPHPGGEEAEIEALEQQARRGELAQLATMLDAYKEKRRTEDTRRAALEPPEVRLVGDAVLPADGALGGEG